MGNHRRIGDAETDSESIDDLPEACIANAMSFTTPRDACRLSTLSSAFKSASESDALWEKFLPQNYKKIIASSSDRTLMDRCPTKKELFLHLADNPLFVDGGLKSFSLAKSSGKIQYMLSARGMTIIWADTPAYWAWASNPKSRFSEVAELLCVCWLEIRGKINTSMLSRRTLYAAYFVFQLKTRAYGFDYTPVKISVGLVGTEPSKREVCLDTRKRRSRRGVIVLRRRFFPFRRGSELPTPTPVVSDQDDAETNGVTERGDGWLEVELGEYFNGDESENEELEMCVMEVEHGEWKVGLVVHGIEVRPKHVLT